MPRALDLTGQRFGKLVVIKCVGRKRTHKNYLCQCDCGNLHEVTSPDLKSGRVNSCGCLRREIRIQKNTTHNLRKHRLFSIWANMKSRCYNPNTDHYSSYGARGIRVCEEWLNDFQAFYDWAMKNGYRDDLTIDRIEVNGNYEPGNCRWATSKRQANNTRRCVKVILNGETKTLSEWCDLLGINYRTVQDRRRRGWKIEDALLTRVGG